MYTFLSLRLLVNYSFLRSHYDTDSLEIYSRYYFVEDPFSDLFRIFPRLPFDSASENIKDIVRKNI